MRYFDKWKICPWPDSMSEGEWQILISGSFSTRNWEVSIFQKADGGRLLPAGLKPRTSRPHESPVGFLDPEQILKGGDSFEAKAATAGT